MSDENNITHELILSEERQKRSRLKSEVEAKEQSFKKFVTGALKLQTNKRNIGREALHVMKGGGSNLETQENFGGFADVTGFEEMPRLESEVPDFEDLD